MSASSPAASRPSARRALVSALHALRARPAALALLFVPCLLRLIPVYDGLTRVLPPLAYWAVAAPLCLALFVLLRVGSLLVCVRVLVRGEPPRLGTLFAPFTWGVRRGLLPALAVVLLVPVFFVLSSLPIALLAYLLPSLASVFFALFLAPLLMSLYMPVALARSEGACGVRGLVRGMRGRRGPLLALVLLLFLLPALLVLLPYLPEIFSTGNGALVDVRLGPLAALKTFSLGKVVRFLFLSLTSVLLDASLVFLFEQPCGEKARVRSLRLRPVRLSPLDPVRAALRSFTARPLALPGVLALLFLARSLPDNGFDLFGMAYFNLPHPLDHLLNLSLALIKWMGFLCALHLMRTAFVRRERLTIRAFTAPLAWPRAWLLAAVTQLVALLLASAGRHLSPLHEAAAPPLNVLLFFAQGILTLPFLSFALPLIEFTRGRARLRDAAVCLRRRVVPLVVTLLVTDGLFYLLSSMPVFELLLQSPSSVYYEALPVPVWLSALALLVAALRLTALSFLYQEAELPHARRRFSALRPVPLSASGRAGRAGRAGSARTHLRTH